ncbi:MAG TPA: SUMF1/EgtB/PvdO family nonheme iron enzyme [Polyangiaceae bacterium]|nr:SUMF1/EgtB/PvdO family nonheme iron enzyme [Polyangiaceae bacterium]
MRGCLLLLAGAALPSSCQRVEAAPHANVEPASAPPPRTQEDDVALASLRGPGKAAPAESSACGDNMVLVEGDYCPKVQLNCKKYLDPKGRYEQFRCAEYGPSQCLSKERRHLRFCIDRTEFAEAGETLPANHRSYTHGEKACAAQGKRMCRESEWNFACEGEEMRPYPYGFTRDASACNADRIDVVSPEGKLRDLRAPGGSFARCKSPFGVMDMAGNLEEFVAMDVKGPVQPAMKGAYWQPSRNFCRAAQTAHDRYYNGTETGFRCCSDAPEAE